MFAIIGATGNVGFSTSSALRKAGTSVRAIVHDAAKADRLRDIGCEVVQADLQDSAALAEAIYVLHAFQKKTRQTAQRDLDLARSRLREQMARAR